MIRFSCNHCTSYLEFLSELGGTVQECSHCRGTLQVPYPQVNTVSSQQRNGQREVLDVAEKLSHTLPGVLLDPMLSRYQWLQNFNMQQPNWERDSLEIFNPTKLRNDLVTALSKFEALWVFELEKRSACRLNSHLGAQDRLLLQQQIEALVHCLAPLEEAYSLVLKRQRGSVDVKKENVEKTATDVGVGAIIGGVLFGEVGAWVGGGLGTLVAGNSIENQKNEEWQGLFEAIHYFFDQVKQSLPHIQISLQRAVYPSLESFCQADKVKFAQLVENIEREWNTANSNLRLLTHDPLKEAERQYPEVTDVREIVCRKISQVQENSLFMGENIPQNKLINVLSTYAAGVKPQEEVLVLYDDTVFGGARDGFLLTTFHLYWHNFGQEAFYIPLADIERCSVSGAQLDMNGYFISVSTLSEPARVIVRDLFLRLSKCFK